MRMGVKLVVVGALLLRGSLSLGQEADTHMHGATADAGGAVMHENTDMLPRDCEVISGDEEITVYAGREYAADYPDRVFGFSQHEYTVEPCSRITVTFINNDQVRHQWMVHGLPRYLYPGGMFHIEADGGERRTGVFIVPSDDRTYLVHCDMPQHMEKGMKAQLFVGNGSGDLWSIPGVSGDFDADAYLPESTGTQVLLAFLAGLAVTLLGIWIRR